MKAKMKPILFNTDMVRAILAGRKTVTRRAVKGANSEWSYIGLSDNMALIATDRCGMEKGKLVEGLWATFEGWAGYTDFPCFKARYRPGEILYVRERFAYLFGRYVYRADYDKVTEESKPFWKPSIHMPREAARIFLRVTDVRVERLQDIMRDPSGPNNQIVREGHRYGCDFVAAWDRPIKPKDKNKYGWAANPWVWVISFERISKEEAISDA